MKNVYARFSYETRLDGEVRDPYVQLMPVTDIEDAHNDWVTWCAKWGGSSSQPSFLPSVHPTPSSSSHSTPSSHSALSSHSSSFSSSRSPPSSSLSSSSSASNPLATDGSDRIAGAVEDDGTEEKSDPVRLFVSRSSISVRLT